MEIQTKKKKFIFVWISQILFGFRLHPLKSLTWFGINLIDKLH